MTIEEICDREFGDNILNMIEAPDVRKRATELSDEAGITEPAERVHWLSQFSQFIVIRNLLAESAKIKETCIQIDTTVELTDAQKQERDELILKAVADFDRKALRDADLSKGGV